MPEKDLKNNYLVSIIVPVYNVEKYLEECLDSLIKQTYTNIEIIAVNDGSPDGSRAILEKFKNIDSRITVIDKPNGGISSARNAGLKICKGDFIMFVDSDDYISHEMTEKMLAAALEDDSDIVKCGFCRFNESGVFSKEAFDKKEIIQNKNEILKYFVYSKGIKLIPVWNGLYRKRIAKDIEFIEGCINEDIYATGLYYYKSTKLTILPKEYYYYRDNPTSVQNTVYEKRIDELITRAALYEYLRKNGGVSKDILDRMLFAMATTFYKRVTLGKCPIRKVSRGLVTLCAKHLSFRRRMKLHYYIWKRNIKLT